MSELLEQLRKAVGDSNVLAGESVHADYTHDEALTSVPVVPLAVVLPGSTKEVSEVLHVASEHSVPVVARGSGTGLSGAAVPVAEGILLAFDACSGSSRSTSRTRSPSSSRASLWSN